MTNVEARARLARLFAVCEQERETLDALRDGRLSGVLEAMARLRAEIVAALAALTPDERNGI